MSGKREREGTSNREAKKRRFIDSVNPGAKGPALPHGKHGILVTMESQDLKRGSKEAINVLTEIWEKLLPATNVEGNPSSPLNTAGGATGDDGKCTDFAGLIQSEVKDIKDVKKQPFRVHDTGIKTVFFLEMLADGQGPSPNEVVAELVRSTKATGVRRFRYCNRFLPCTHICKGDLQAIKEAAAEAVPTFLNCSKDAERQTVAVLYEHRAAPSKLDRMEVIDAIMEQVPRPPHEVKLKGATRTISVQVVRNACGLGVFQDYEASCRYNVKALSESCGASAKNDGGQAAAEHKASPQVAGKPELSSAEADTSTASPNVPGDGTTVRPGAEAKAAKLADAAGGVPDMQEASEAAVS